MDALRSSPKVMAPWAHWVAHRRQPTQRRGATIGLPWACCSILPRREPQPIPKFLMAPPKPVCSCPLKWDREMITSASMMAFPILAVWMYSAPSTGTSTSSLPRKPSPMITWQPVDSGEKPFS